MICKQCNGSGKTYNPGYGEENCCRCHGTGKVEQTEQEYIQTADTEQLAEFLNRVFQAKAFCEICDIRKRCKISAGCKYGNKPYKECWKEWLKQPHTDKE